MGAVTRATDAAEQIRLLRGYLAGLRHTNLALRRWVDDTSLPGSQRQDVPATCTLRPGVVSAFRAC